MPYSFSELPKFVFEKVPHYVDHGKKGILIISQGLLVSHANKVINLISTYNGLGELWHEEITDNGTYYRGDGGESSMYLSNKGGRLCMNDVKGYTELWKNKI